MKHLINEECEGGRAAGGKGKGEAKVDERDGKNEIVSLEGESRVRGNVVLKEGGSWREWGKKGQTIEGRERGQQLPSAGKSYKGRG